MAMHAHAGLAFYDTLHAFVAAGLVREFTLDGTAARYDANLDQHHHFVCDRCVRAVPDRMKSFERRLRKMPLDGAPAGWDVVDGHHIQKTFKFPDFVTALAFVNRVGAIAEEQGHHPDLLLSWGKVEVSSFTHTADGLSEKDYVLATAIDRVSDTDPAKR